MNPITIEARLLTVQQLAGRFAEAAKSLWPDADPVVDFEPTRHQAHGELATNVAFTLTRVARKKPDVIAAEVVRCAMEDASVCATIQHVETVKGFINVTLRPSVWQQVIQDVLTIRSDYGRGISAGERVSLEFGSANPTGPLVVVQGRTMAIGDTLARVMRHAGYDVYTEWIVNDAGGQMEALGKSVFARYAGLYGIVRPIPEDGYLGEYIIDIAKAIRDSSGDRFLEMDEREAVDEIARIARDLLVAEQQAVAHKFRAHYDRWQYESQLHTDGAIKRGIERLRELGLLFSEDGATWLRTRDYGDDENRVVIRKDGRPTYFANDVAYHYDKLQRSEHVIDILGPDHHGYIGRLNALAAAYKRPGSIEVLIAQQITLKRGDAVVPMSKRAGTLVTLDDVINEVGVDAARFFFLLTSTEQPLTFDLELAKRQTDENPVFYVQYANTRIASLIRRASIRNRRLVIRAHRGDGLELLTEPEEIALARRIHEFERTIATIARDRAPHRLTLYLRALASDWHKYYDKHRILVEKDDLVVARLALALATQIVLQKALELCGVTAPEVMVWGGDSAPRFVAEPRQRALASEIGYFSGLAEGELLELTRDTINLLVRYTADARKAASYGENSPSLNTLLGLSILAIGEARAILMLVSAGIERPSRIHLRSLFEYITKARAALQQPNIARTFAASAASELRHIASMLPIPHDVIGRAGALFLGEDLETLSLNQKGKVRNDRKVLERASGSEEDYALHYTWTSQVAHGSVLALDEVWHSVRGTGTDFIMQTTRDRLGPLYLVEASTRVLHFCALQFRFFGFKGKNEITSLAYRLRQVTQDPQAEQYDELHAVLNTMSD